MTWIRSRQRRVRLEVVLAACVLIGMLPDVSLAAPVQQTNLLTNPGFESAFAADGVGDGWVKWVVSGAPAYKQITSSLDSRRVNDGSSAQQIEGIDISYVAGLQQTVSGLTVGKTYRFTIYAHAWANTGDNTNASTGTITLKVGIGPGDTYAADPNVTWSGSYAYTDNFGQLSVEMVATDTTATVFTHAATIALQKHNDVYWDNAALIEVGASTDTPVATTVATQVSQVNGELVAPTDFPMPTPDDSGQIIYYVQPNDNLVHIATIACGETMECLDKLKLTNGITGDIIIPGQRLVLGPLEGTPMAVAVADVDETATPSDDANSSADTVTEDVVVADGETFTAEESPIEQTPPPEATGAICVTLYADSNGNGVLDVGEQLVAEGIFSLVNLDNGETINSYTTDGTSEPYCFPDLETGTFRVISAAPAGHTPTTRVDWDLTLAAGSTANLEFGAQFTDAPTATTTSTP